MRGADGASGADGGGGGPVIVSTDATDIQGTPVSANPPTLGQVLAFNGLELAYVDDNAFTPAVPSDWSPVPSNFDEAIDQLMALHQAFGLVIAKPRRTTPLTTATLPGPSPYAGASDYLNIGTVGAPIPLDPGTYAAWVGYIVSVDQNTTEFWIDASVLGAPSAEGPSNQPLGKANAQANSTFTLTFDVLVPLNFYATIRVAKGGGPGNVTFRAAYAVLTRLI